MLSEEERRIFAAVLSETDCRCNIVLTKKLKLKGQAPILLLAMGTYLSSHLAREGSFLGGRVNQIEFNKAE
eukprot:scaffold10156_cov98-Skeletonema_dohrnii-CCMP3373.AAC.2